MKKYYFTPLMLLWTIPLLAGILLFILYNNIEKGNGTLVLMITIVSFIIISLLGFVFHFIHRIKTWKNVVYYDRFIMIKTELVFKIDHEYVKKWASNLSSPVRETYKEIKRKNYITLDKSTKFLTATVKPVGTVIQKIGTMQRKVHALQYARKIELECKTNEIMTKLLKHEIGHHLLNCNNIPINQHHEIMRNANF